MSDVNLLNQNAGRFIKVQGAEDLIRRLAPGEVFVLTDPLTGEETYCEKTKDNRGKVLGTIMPGVSHEH